MVFRPETFRFTNRCGLSKTSFIQSPDFARSVPDHAVVVSTISHSIIEFGGQEGSARAVSL